MTLPASSRRSPVYLGNGVTTAFPFTYRVFSTADVQVLRTTADGTITTLVLDGDYSVTLNPDQTVSPGGTVNYPLIGSPLPTGASLVSLGALPYDQTLALPGGGNFNPVAIERNFDRMEMQIQQLADGVASSLRVPVGETVSTFPNAATRANTQPAFDALGNVTVMAPVSGSAVDVLIQLANSLLVGLGDALVAIKRTVTGAIASTLHAWHEAQPLDPVADFGADPTGVVDASAAFQAALTGSKQVVVPAGTYKIGTTLTMIDGQTIRGIGRPQLVAVTAGQHILSAVARNNVTVEGVRFKGVNSSTAPLTSVGGFASTSTGLLTITAGSDVRVTDCEFDTFYNGLACLNCDRLFVLGNRVTHWLVYGILASLAKRFWIDRNVLKGCDQTGAANAYGVSATGDEAGGNIQVSGSISYNAIEDVPSWDAIMTHDVSVLHAIANRIKNVRSGLDISYTSAANEIRELVLAFNIIEATTTDTWAGAAAVHNAILVSGFSATDRISNVLVIGNIAKNFFTMGGAPTFAGNAAHIVLVHLDRGVLGHNIVSGGGSVGSPAGLFLAGTVNQTGVNSNALQGSFPSGAIRAASLTFDVLSIGANVIKQTTVSDPDVQFSSSTGTLQLGENASGSTTKFTQSGSTIVLTGTSFLLYSGTWDPASVTTGSRDTTTITVTGASVGDYVAVSFSLPLQGMSLTGYVDSANTVVVVLSNNTGGTINLGSGTLRARVQRT